MLWLCERLARALSFRRLLHSFFAIAINRSQKCHSISRSPLTGLHAPALLPGVEHAVKKLFGKPFNKTKNLHLWRLRCRWRYRNFHPLGLVEFLEVRGVLRSSSTRRRLWAEFRSPQNHLRSRRFYGSNCRLWDRKSLGSRSSKRTRTSFVVTDHHEMKEKTPQRSLARTSAINGYFLSLGGLSGQEFI